MSYQERASLISIAVNLLVNAWVVVRLLELDGAGALSGPDAAQAWARVMVWAMPVSIGLVITLHVALAIVSRRGGDGPLSDERDRLFQVRGLWVTTGSFAVGLIAAVVGLANGWAPVLGFLSIYVGATLGDLVGNGVRIASYRIGG